MEFGGPPPPKTHLGLASCSLLKDYVRTYPYLKEVAVLLKTFLAENNLNQSYLGKFVTFLNFLFRRHKFVQRRTPDSGIHE
jgi:DNA polymerase sigma